MLLHQTTSVCPACFKRIPAAYVARQGQVWFEKNCPEHGADKVPVWDSVEGYQHWVRTTPAQAPVGPLKPVEHGCPYDCGLCADHQQASCCVLFEVTARCDLRCPVCFASAGDDSELIDPDLDTIRGWYAMLLEHGGPFNIQLSGGEPTMRDDLDQVIAIGRQMGFRFFQLNTNGIRIAREPDYLAGLVEAGLNTVFLQFDTFDQQTSIALRGKDLRETKQLAIRQCKAAGVAVVLVPTVRADLNLHEVGAIVDYAADHMPAVRGVHFQPISFFGRYDSYDRESGKVTIPMLLGALEEQTEGRVRSGDFSPGNAEHSLCTFYADYLVQEDKWSARKSQTSGCCGATSDQARDVVAMKWSAPISQKTITSNTKAFNVRSLDDFLQTRQSQTLALSGMAFQDAWSIDLERLHRCHVHVVSPTGELVPFCSYNLTNTSGKALHREINTR